MDCMIQLSVRWTHLPSSSGGCCVVRSRSRLGCTPARAKGHVVQAVQAPSRHIHRGRSERDAGG